MEVITAFKKWFKFFLLGDVPTFYTDKQQLLKEDGSKLCFWFVGDTFTCNSAYYVKEEWDKVTDENIKKKLS